MNWFEDWYKIPSSDYDLAKAQELLCPMGCGELKDLSDMSKGAASCPVCGRLYIWRVTPQPWD